MKDQPTHYRITCVVSVEEWEALEKAMEETNTYLIEMEDIISDEDPDEDK